MSFQQALQSSQDSERTILLGNGFSIAANPIFDYRNLFEQAQIDSRMRTIFTEMETFDFEIVINKLENAYKLLELYSDGYPELVREMKSSSDLLRQSFSQVLSSKHISYRKVFSQKNDVNDPVKSCFQFLSNFKTVFTTNYDLLLYWSINLNNEKFYQEKKIVIPTNDGFSRFYENLIWKGNYTQRKQRVFFLHGALFLYQEDGVLMKMERKEDEDLLSVVEEGIIDHGNFPLIVLEGESKNKMIKIAEHPYLNDALQHLSKLSGPLFIYGHSLDKSDDHIFNKIKESNCNNIYVSVFDENLSEYIYDRAHSLFTHPIKERQISIFNAISANVWI
jgi:hypothetical protein